MIDLSALPQIFSLRLILLRHGEPEQEAKGRCYGSLDFGLSQAGRTQVQSKLGAIKNFTAQALYSSPLKRATESAAIAGALLRLPSIVSPDLREINFGSFEGLAYDEVERLYPEQYRIWMERPTEIKFPQGESFADVKVRVLRFKEFLLCTHAGKTAVVISHGGVNRIILADALKISDPMIFRLDQAYASLNIIDYTDGSPIVRLMNG